MENIKKKVAAFLERENT
jgi:hypothetical protein